jgi:hypothetical protein
MQQHTLIPPDWSPDEALRFCHFLDALYSAIWRAHGHAMNLHLDGIAAHDLEPTEDDHSKIF